MDKKRGAWFKESHSKLPVMLPVLRQVGGPGCEVCFNPQSVLLSSEPHKEDRAWITGEESLLWLPALHTLAVPPQGGTLLSEPQCSHL